MHKIGHQLFFIFCRVHPSIHNWSVFLYKCKKYLLLSNIFLCFTLNWINNVLDVITEYVRMITQKINSLLYDQRKMKVYQRHLTTVTTENYVLSSLWRKRKKEIGLNFCLPQWNCMKLFRFHLWYGKNVLIYL